MTNKHHLAKITDHKIDPSILSFDLAGLTEAFQVHNNLVGAHGHDVVEGLVKAKVRRIVTLIGEDLLHVGLICSFQLYNKGQEFGLMVLFREAIKGAILIQGVHDIPHRSKHHVGGAFQLARCQNSHSCFWILGVSQSRSHTNKWTSTQKSQTNLLERLKKTQITLKDTQQILWEGLVVRPFGKTSLNSTTNSTLFVFLSPKDPSPRRTLCRWRRTNNWRVARWQCEGWRWIDPSPVWLKPPGSDVSR